jgi:hypothetical protein
MLLPLNPAQCIYSSVSIQGNNTMVRSVINSSYNERCYHFVVRSSKVSSTGMVGSYRMEIYGQYSKNHQLNI